ncbi:MAG: YjfI family protein [Kangiellaceae bacterium]|nr:YjfI family protein [Kangiellaceae bacterium]
MNNLQELSNQLANYEFKGHQFSCLTIEGDYKVLRVEVSELEEMPIFLTITETQILCISYLFNKDEIFEAKQAELNQYLLELNVPMPLSAFAVIDDYYAIFGALSCGSTLDSVSDELVTLAANSIDSLQALEEFIK